MSIIIYNKENPNQSIYLLITLAGIVNLRANSIIAKLVMTFMRGVFTDQIDFISDSYDLFIKFYRFIVFIIAFLLTFITNLQKIQGESSVLIPLSENLAAYNYGIVSIFAFDRIIDGWEKMKLRFIDLRTNQFDI